MNRQDVLLAALAASQGRPYSPVQIQKTMFLISKNIPKVFSNGTVYKFSPYDYGPFDSDVYVDAEKLEKDGLVEIIKGGRWKNYAATDEGLKKGKEVLNLMKPERKTYIKEVSKWVRGQDFAQLVNAIYEQYPDMKANSIFKG